MQFTARSKNDKDESAALFQSLAPLIKGIGMSLVELSVFHAHRSAGVQVKAVVMSGGDAAGTESTGVDDCAKAHRLVLPRLELAFPGKDIYLEVSSPGIDRLIKDGSEFAHYIGRGVRCYRTDISDWTAGFLRAADEEKIVLEGEEGETVLALALIAKARLTSALNNKGG